MTKFSVECGWKLYGRKLIETVGDGAECAIWDEQCGFRKGRLAAGV